MYPVWLPNETVPRDCAAFIVTLSGFTATYSSGVTSVLRRAVILLGVCEWKAGRRLTVPLFLSQSPD